MLEHQHAVGVDAVLQRVAQAALGAVGGVGGGAPVGVDGLSGWRAPERPAGASGRSAHEARCLAQPVAEGAEVEPVAPIDRAAGEPAGGVREALGACSVGEHRCGIRGWLWG